MDSTFEVKKPSPKHTPKEPSIKSKTGSIGSMQAPNNIFDEDDLKIVEAYIVPADSADNNSQSNLGGEIVIYSLPNSEVSLDQTSKGKTKDTFESPGKKHSGTLPVVHDNTRNNKHENISVKSPVPSPKVKDAASPPKKLVVPLNKILAESSTHSANTKPQKTKTSEQSVNSRIKPEDIEAQGQAITNHVDNLTQAVNKMSQAAEVSQKPATITNNIDKIANMSRMLTNEANALRNSIKSLSKDLARSKEISSMKDEDVNFPYHLFLVEIIINKIHMKCECFDIDCNNLIISAAFLGKQPIVLYDPSYGRIENFSKLNVGKSILFAMTYDKICNVKDFEIVIQLTKQPPCSNCATKIGETRIDCTKEFVELREELCKKWTHDQPDDNIICTTSSPLSRNLYYLSCGDTDHQDSIGVIEVTVRLSFLGKEITTAFSARPKPQGTSFLMKEDNGMTLYSCQKVEMDDQGKILLDEGSLTKKPRSRNHNSLPSTRDMSPMSQISSISSSHRSHNPIPHPYNHDERPKTPKYHEIYTKMNANELKIRVPKTSRLDRMGKYDKIQELCSCESTTYNSGEQIQFELPKDLCNPDKSHNNYSSNLKYTYNGCDRSCDRKDRKIINVTPTNCPAPVDMEKMLHPQKDVFILKIGKKMETKDKKTDLEIELVTPKAPAEKTYIDHTPHLNNNISQQCSTNELKKKVSKTDKKTSKTKSKSKPKKGGHEKLKKPKNKK